MKTLITLLATSVLLLTGCGSIGGNKDNDNGAASGGDGSDEDNYKYAMVTTSADKPDCNDSSEGRLIYLSDDQKFQYCKNGNWKNIDLKGPKGDSVAGAAGAAGADGLSIASIWRYHVDTYAGAPNISSEASFFTMVGTVHVTVFANGSAFVSVVGMEIDEDTDADMYNENFADSFFLKPLASEQTYISKFKSYANTRARYKVTISSTPVFKAVIDNDGNFDDNTDTSFALTQVN